MITTEFRQLDTTDTEWLISHLFEHLVIDGFYTFLEQYAIDRRLFGWVEADTFDGRIFLNAGFYNPRVARLFNKYVDNIPNYTESDIQYAIAAVQAEDRVLIDITDYNQLKLALKKLSKRKWNTDLGHDTKDTSISRKITTEKHSAKSFKDIVVAVRASNLSPDEQKLLLRFRTTLIDIINSSIRSFTGVYPRGSSEIALHGNSMAFMVGFTVTKGITQLDDIESDCQSSIDTFSVSKHRKEITRHFRAFASEPLWQSIPVEYYRSTGIVTTNQEISSLATKKNIESLLTKIHIEVRSSTVNDRQHIY